MRLDDLRGQDQAVSVLRRAIATRRVPHAYLFEGPPGVGKRSAAIGLAMALDCEAVRGATAALGTPSACGICETCRRIDAGLHPDVLTFAATGPQILIEQAQEIVALGQRAPHEAPARVVVIRDADRLNVNAANCLLKTLEEPAPGTHLVLCTAAPERLLGTIRSRTQRIRFRAVPTATLLEIASVRNLDRARAEVAAVIADGCVARFIGLASDTEDDGTRAAAALLRAAARGRGIAPILDAAVELGDKESKDRLPDVLTLMGRIYRDALVEVVGAGELAVLAGPAASSEREDDGLRGPTNLGPAALARSIGAVVEAETALAGNANAVLTLERLLLTLRREERAAS
jgi:DNA polymerase III subunit delta'